MLWDQEAGGQTIRTQTSKLRDPANLEALPAPECVHRLSNSPRLPSRPSSLALTLRFCLCMRAMSLQLYLTLGKAMDCSPPGSSVHGILQARTLEWIVISSSRGSSPPRDGTRVSYVCWQVGSIPLEPPGKLEIMPRWN